jgi:uncharacterized damage-inducible protein DinB
MVFRARRTVPLLGDGQCPVLHCVARLHASFDELRAQRGALDARIRNWVDGLTEADLEATLEFRSIAYSGERSATLWKLVVHFFNHQTHHRGQLTTLLSQAKADYGVTDLMWLPGVLDG